MKLPLRIAILECDTPLTNTKAKFGGYGGVFKQLLERAAETLKQPGLSATEGLELSFYDVVQSKSYPALDDIDAILITGSKHSAYLDDPWILDLVEFVKTTLHQERVRIIGVCFGHQIVGRALGQRVYLGDAGWEVSVTPIELSEAGKALFQRPELSLYQMHRDIVYGCPSGVEQLGSTDGCSNQGMYQKDRLITVQGHPEFTKEIEEEILHARHAAGIFPDGIYEDAIKRLPDHDQGVEVGKAFLRFLLN
ncbi:class I glutamine amidotransferase-like protein [Trichodelitschia bisporula]|uniref:Class I glutamine amidotransferase-like protein n=1 Tax=Trichodelitschia bisporula TaxID=703511 RepID=A0A6G1HLF5_9PEZI|nr:class I glutamine amidotransferase-like protein [Trichodelitschia bisporula]